MNLLLDDVQSERLHFRKIQLSDLDEWLPFHRDKRTSKYWKGLPKDPEVACQQQIDNTLRRYEEGRGGMNALILKEKGELIGLCGLLPQVVDTIQELEIAYSILPTHWGQGFATEAALQCKLFAADNEFNDSLISIIQVDNQPSQRVALKNGMHLDKTTVYHKNKVHIYRTIL